MMRQVANDKGYTLNEYNIEKYSSDKKNRVKNIIDPEGEKIKVETDIFEFLEMEYREPCERL
jgi:DNA polymerase/3'-5' exonuclease PolX